jgi:alkylation response protein AidB-like acyl-CoA dehydrogenase
MDAIRIPPPAELDSLDDEQFRHVVRAFLHENYPEELRNPPKRLHWSENKPWYMTLAERGWLCPGWPKEYGGLGLSPGKQIILTEEYERYGVARTNDHGIVMLGPLVIKYGTEEQKQQFLPKILTGEHIWCQGYSEPNAGSDLAALRTEAVLDGDHYVVNGQKIWTTLAQYADWIFCLVRTDPTAKAQEGISFLLIDMKTPGITVRPIVTIDGGQEVNEVFFDNVEVPAENLVGQENKGWDYAKFLLGNERTGIARVGTSKAKIARIKELAALEFAGEKPLIESPRFLEKIAAVEVELKALEMTQLRVVSDERKLAKGQQNPTSSILKLKGSVIQQQLTELLMEVVGPYVMPYQRDFEGNNEPIIGPDYASEAAPMYFNYRKVSIYGGSNEIQRNIIAKAILGL